MHIEPSKLQENDTENDVCVDLAYLNENDINIDEIDMNIEVNYMNIEENDMNIDENDTVVEHVDSITVIVDIHDEEEINEETETDNLVLEKSEDILYVSNKKDIIEEPDQIKSKPNYVKTIDNTFGGKTFSCKMCNYEAVKKFDITTHKEDVHNWCSQCFSTFNNREKLKNHITKKHIK